MASKIVGRFRSPSKTDRRRVSRVKLNVNHATVEALNRQMERAVQADLHSGITRFRRDIAKGQLDRAFNLQSYGQLMMALPYKHFDRATAKASRRVAAIIPTTAEAVRHGIAGGVRGGAAYDPLFTRPLNFDGADVAPAPSRRANYEADAFARRMDATNPQLYRHTAERKDKYLQDLILPSREQVFDIAGRASIEGWDTDTTTEALSQIVGLNGRQQVALNNKRTKLIEGGYDDAYISEQMQKQSDAYLAQRLQTIAVTEVRAATGAAQLEAWYAMQDQGLIGPDAQKQWVVGAEDACPKICFPIDGQIVPLREDFILGNGKPCAMGGLAHPRCRCSAILLDEGEEPVGRNEAAFRSKEELEDIFGPDDDDEDT